MKKLYILTALTLLLTLSSCKKIGFADAEVQALNPVQLYNCLRYIYQR